MTLTDRDRRILLVLVPVVILIAYWFLLLSPKRSDLSDARDQQDAAEQARDDAVALAAQRERARQTFASDYAAVVRLGKAIPAAIDTPSLLVQLDRASRGTHVDFNSVTVGARTQSTAPAAAATPPAQPGGNAAAGGAPAQTGPGQATESAGNTVNAANQSSATAAGGTGTTGPAGAQSGPSTATAALDQVALTFNFNGGYFDLADFFHRLKRLVYVANNRIFVRGRLMTIDTLTFARAGDEGAAATPASASGITATVGATVYLSPKTTGVAGGATAAGPTGTATTPPPAGQSAARALPTATAGLR